MSRLFAFAFAAALAALPSAASARHHEVPPIEVHDIAYGEVLYDFYQGNYLEALTRLEAAKVRNEFSANRDDAELLLGGLYLSYGEHELAASIFERLLAKSTDAAVQDRAWYFLAKIRYERGYLPEAEQALARIAHPLPADLEPDRRLLEARVLMDEGKFEAARAKLESWKKPADEWIGYAKYNLGVALVRLGRVDEGARVLAEVGALETTDPELLALRDKADVALGYAWLQAARPGEAKPALERVRLDGPFSNKALLGLGWADAELKQYREALTPWTELAGRDLLDSAVQESLLAVPYAFAELGADGQAAARYTDSIKTFDAEMGRLDEAIGRVRDGELIGRLLASGRLGADGWYWRLDALPDSPESRYLYALVATNRFQEALKNCRDLMYLLKNLDRWEDSVGAFHDILDTRQRAYDERKPLINRSLEQVDLDAMAAQRVELDSRLETIEATNDSVALGTPKQQQMWRKLKAMEPQLATLGSDAHSEELREKEHFLAGLLQWDLDRDYRARLWAEKKSLRRLDLDLKEAQGRRHEVAQARDEWPDQFEALTARIDAVQPRLDALRGAVSSELERQKAYLETLAADELEAQRHRLETYRLQAQFSLAAIYDRAAAAPPPRRARPAESGKERP